MFRIISCFIWMFMLWPLAAWADVAALSYTDPENAPQIVSPTRQYINPSGSLSLYLTGGLDRKVGYVLTDAAGSTVAEAVSGLISASDTITALGQTYYGKILSTPVALDDGSYTLTAQIMDAGGNALGTNSYPLVVNRTPPSASGDIWYNQSAYHQGSINTPYPQWNGYGDGFVVGHCECSNILAKNVGSVIGIDRVQFESFNPADGSVYYSVPAWYDSSTQTAGVGNGSYWSVGVGYHLPLMNGPLGLRFIIYDKSGNKTVVQGTVKFHGVYSPDPQLVAIYNPNVTSELIPGSGMVGFVPYAPGMTTYANPLQLIYRVPKTNWVTYNPDYGLSAIGGTVVYTDDQYVYVRFDGTYSSDGMIPYGNDQFSSNTQWCTHTINYNLVLADTAPKSPVFVSWQYYRSDTGWSDLTPNDFWFKSNNPFSITKIRAVVEPRDYDQVFVEPVCGTCTIPAGQTECTLDTTISPAPGTMNLHHTYCYVKKQDGSLSSAIKHTTLMWDLLLPSITFHSLSQANKVVTFTVNEPNTGAYWGNVGLGSGWLSARNIATGQEVQVNGTVQSMSGDDHQITASYSTLPEGEWQFTLWAQDNFGNTVSLPADTLVLDQTPPTVQFYRETAAMADHDATDSLGKLSFTVTDNLDPAPQLESVRFTGGPQNIDVYLATRLQQGAYLLEYPVMHPSAGQEYTLAVTSKDAMGNRVTKTLSFSYAPPTVQLSSGGQGGTLNLPALPAAVVHTDGSNALVTEPLTVGGQAVSGVYDLVVVSGAGSTATAVVNNVTVAPGEQKTISGYDFNAHGGRLDLPLWSEQPGEAHLVVTSLAPNFPVLTASVRFWQPEVTLTADPGWGVQPLLQTQKIGAVVSGAPCSLTFDAQEAQAADPINSPKCLVEFLRKPSMYQLQDGLLQGVLGPDDALAVDYQVAIYNGGQKYVYGSGSYALERLPVTDVSVALSANPENQVYRKVQTLQIAAQSDGPVTCKTTTSEARAQQLALYNIVCLVRWTQTANGLQPAGDDSANLSGTLEDLGDQNLTMTVDLYTPFGTMLNAFSRSLALSTVNPPPPILGFNPSLYGEKLTEDSFVTSELTRGEFGIVQFTPGTTRAYFTLEIEEESEGLKSYQYMTTNNLTFSRLLYAGPLAVWQTKAVTVRAYYTYLPEIKVEQRLNVIGVPSKRVQAILTAPREATDTIGIPVKLQIGLPGSGSELSYISDRDGTWEACFGLLDNREQFQALTDYQEISGGVLETTLRDFSTGYVRLAAQARLKAPSGIDGYHREIKSNSIFSTVLKGTVPEGRLICRSPSGPAPFATVVALQLDNDSLRVLGDVSWEISEDDGVNWSPVTVKTPLQANFSLTTGQYLVRARLANKITQAVGHTESLQLISYQVPQLTINGPRTVFVESTVNLTAQMDINGQVVPGDQAVVEWYNSKNEKLQEGPTFLLNTQEPQYLNYQVRARLKTSPATDAYAWRRASAAVQVMAPRAPGCVIVAPIYMEHNTIAPQTYTLSARLTPPAGLDTSQYPLRGEWRLPDGRTAEGLELIYTPTDHDGSKHQALIEFTAWIDGYKSETTTSYRRQVPVTVYTWPEFEVQAKPNPPAAPSLVTLTAVPVGLLSSQLEKPVYEWQLPEGVEKVRDLEGGPRTIQAYFPAPGSYQVTVKVTDGRGSTAETTGTVSLQEPAPFEVTFYPSFSNTYRREFLDVVLRPGVRGGHPNDRIVNWNFIVNDPQAEVIGSNENTTIKGLHAGDRLISVRAESKLGKVVELDYPITVLPNQPPTCNITSYDTTGARWFRAFCNDPDGRVTATQWLLDNKLISQAPILCFVRGTPGALHFEAVDDSGAKYSENLATP